MFTRSLRDPHQCDLPSSPPNPPLPSLLCPNTDRDGYNARILHAYVLTTIYRTYPLSHAPRNFFLHWLLYISFYFFYFFIACNLGQLCFSAFTLLSYFLLFIFFIVHSPSRRSISPAYLYPPRRAVESASIRPRSIISRVILF